MRIEFVLVKDLLSFCRANLHQEALGGTVPISVERATAQVNNPNASPSDIALIAAFDDKRCLGYIGLLPGQLAFEGSLHKIFFTSTTFVPPNLRSTLAGLKVARAAADLGLDLVGAANRERGARLWRGMKKTKELSPLEILTLQPPLRPVPLGDYPFTLREVSSLRRELHPVIPISGFYRSLETIEWMLKYSWISQKEDKYYFGQRNWEVRFKALELWDKEENYLGFMVLKSAKKLSTHRHVVSLLDYALKDASYEKWLYFVVMQLAQKESAPEVQYSDRIFQMTQNPILALSLKRREARTYFIREGKSDSPLALASPTLIPQFCDGDTAFT